MGVEGVTLSVRFLRFRARLPLQFGADFMRYLVLSLREQSDLVRLALQADILLFSNAIFSQTTFVRFQFLQLIFK